MKARTLIDLLSLSSNLYLIAKDDELLKNLKDWAKESRQKAGEVWDELGEDASEDADLMEKILVRVKAAKTEFDRKVEETAVKVYAKMQIAHANDVRELEKKLEDLKKELALAEARIVHLESPQRR